MDEKRNKKNTMKKLLEKEWVCYTIGGCTIGLVFVLLSHLGTVFTYIGGLYRIISPVVIGIVIAYLLNPIVDVLEERMLYKIRKEKIRHTIAVILMLLGLALILTLLLLALVPSVWNSILSIIQNMDGYITNMQEYIEKADKIATMLNLDIASITRTMGTSVSQYMGQFAQNMGTIMEISSGIGSKILNLFLGTILAIYFLLGKKSILAGIDRLRHAIYSDKVYKQRSDFWVRCHHIFIQYIGFDVLDGLIIGIINAIFMLIAGMPYIALISVIIAVTNLLPTFGPIIGALIAEVIIVLDSPQKALIFLIFTFILQTIDGYVLKPKLFGGSLGVPAVWILVSIILGGKMFGVIGILLGIPFAAIFTIIYEEQILRWLQEKKREKEK